MELKRRGFDIYYYKTSNNLEVDFIVSQNNAITELIQVSKSIKDEKTLSREISPFKKTIDELKLSSDIKCMIISEDNSSKNGDIDIINIQEFLLVIR